MQKSRLRLSEWASIAEVIGAIGVVVSLIYVGIQVKDNTAEIRATNRQALIGRAHTATMGVGSNPGLASAMAKLSAGSNLTPAETVQYEYFVRGLIYDVQEAFVLRGEERLDENYWQTREALFDSFMSRQVAREVYLRDKEVGVFLPDFVSWADGQLGLDNTP